MLPRRHGTGAKVWAAYLVGLALGLGIYLAFFAGVLLLVKLILL